MFVRLLLVTVLAYICFFNLNPDHCYAFGKKHGNDGGILSRKKSGEVKPDDEIDESRISIGIDDSIGDILRVRLSHYKFSIFSFFGPSIIICLKIWFLNLSPLIERSLERRQTRKIVKKVPHQE